MARRKTTGQSLEHIDTAVADDLLRRADEIGHCYRALAEKAGEFYLRADAAGLNEVTRLLNSPMRHAFDGEQAFNAMKQALLARRR